MHKRINFKDTEHSAFIEEYANKQLAKVIDFIEHDGTPIYIDLTFSPSKVHAHHKVELRVKSPRYERVTHYEGPEFKEALDRVIDTMYKELHEDKKRLAEDKKMVGRHGEFKKER